MAEEEKKDRNNEYFITLIKTLALSATIWAFSQIVAVPALRTSTARTDRIMLKLREASNAEHKILKKLINENTVLIRQLSTKEDSVEKSIEDVMEDIDNCRDRFIFNKMMSPKNGKR